MLTVVVNHLSKEIEGSWALKCDLDRYWGVDTIEAGLMRLKAAVWYWVPSCLEDWVTSFGVR